MWRKVVVPLLQAERTIKAYRQEEQWVQIRNITIIAIASFLLMSVINALQQSYIMMLTTLGAAAVLAYFLKQGWQKKKTKHLEWAYLLLLTALFTYYIVIGGNDGFAVLWVVFIPFMCMMMIDVKIGLILSVYFLLLLFLLFYSPLGFLLQFDYPKMIRVRFPVMYLIDFALSFYSIRVMIAARSSLILAQEQIKEASFRDPATGLKNRAAFMEFVNTAPSRNFIRLSVIYIDVNGLHELNNRLGHAAGDEMLRFVAEACVKHFPSADVYRLGGDEFLIISTIGTEGEIQKWMQQLNQTIVNAGYAIAYGIENRLENFDVEDMMNCADAKMLQCKAEFYKARDRRRD